MRLPALALAAILAAAAPTRAADPAGAWRFDPASLAAVADRLAAAMAADLSPAQRRELLTFLKDAEARYAKLQKGTPAAAKAEAELRELRQLAVAMNDPKAFFRREFLATLGDNPTLRLAPDGTVAYTARVGGAERAGNGAWKVEGGAIVIATTLPGSRDLLSLAGPVADKRMELRYAPAPSDRAELKNDPKLTQALRGTTWVLVRP